MKFIYRCDGDLIVKKSRDEFLNIIRKYEAEGKNYKVLQISGKKLNVNNLIFYESYDELIQILSTQDVTIFIYSLDDLVITPDLDIAIKKYTVTNTLIVYFKY